MQNPSMNRIPIASFNDNGRIGYILIDHLISAPYCELCESFQCVHVKYLMSLESGKQSFKETLKLICGECGNYNSKDAKYCTQCGSRLREVD